MARTNKTPTSLTFFEYFDLYYINSIQWILNSQKQQDIRTNSTGICLAVRPSERWRILLTNTRAYWACGDSESSYGPCGHNVLSCDLVWFVCRFLYFVHFQNWVLSAVVDRCYRLLQCGMDVAEWPGNRNETKKRRIHDHKLKNVVRTIEHNRSIEKT